MDELQRHTRSRAGLVSMLTINIASVVIASQDGVVSDEDGAAKLRSCGVTMDNAEWLEEERAKTPHVGGESERAVSAVLHCSIPSQTNFIFKNI